ncbi:DJ-1/PfpI family protein [Pseudonocardia sp. ICBG601]|uniref:DJ-1/PfpI family protein n=1 Tax=Pseudonocardia sp. ICBG601 TaxID=2846759 RepID=UPI001CF69FC1|nr:DJ-1/PfpI family protein [Pseudonocardia sp. ICBG601]
MSQPQDPPRRPVAAMLLFPGLTHLDLVGPHAVLATDMDVHLAWKDTDPVVSDSGMAILPTTTLRDCPREVDLLMVPGGFGTKDVIADPELLDWVADVGARARWVTSVCTGSLVLGAAGLLRGRRATTHWTTRHLLAAFGAENVVARTVVDGNRITGGGVTAGIDFGLTVLAGMLGEERARTVQLALEYDPQPPFDAGTPERSTPAAVAQVRAMVAAANAEIERTTAARAR